MQLYVMICMVAVFMRRIATYYITILAAVKSRIEEFKFSFRKERYVWVAIILEARV